MKKFYNNTLIGGAFSKALRVLALLCVLLGISSSVWAEAGLVDVSFTFSTGTYSDLALSGVEAKSLGTNLTSAPKLTQSIIETYRYNGGNTCGATLYVKYDNGDAKELGSMGHSGNNGNNQWWNWNGNETFPATSGEHTVEFWIKVTGNTGANNCDQEFWASNNSQNYKFTYSIAGGGGGDTPSTGGHKGTNLGFWDNEAWNIKVGNNWSNQSGYGAEGNTEIPLGTIKAGTTIGFWAQTWKKKRYCQCLSAKSVCKDS